MKFSTNYTGWLLGLIALAGIGSTASADTVIVYDASNSMWGQIEGEAKVTIARRVLGELVRDWDESESLGLVAYGHRREGDCNDTRRALLCQLLAPARQRTGVQTLATGPSPFLAVRHDIGFGQQAFFSPAMKRRRVRFLRVGSMMTSSGSDVSSRL